MNYDEITESLFSPVCSGAVDDVETLMANKPFLVHYTSIDVLEKIIVSDEIWLSNPLFMNDLEEVRFGLQEGMKLFVQSPIVVDACETPQRAEIVKNAFVYYYNQFDLEHAFDTYVFCLSEHDPDNINGLLSMWRAYGGRGNGAALVFKTDLTTRNDKSPLMMVKVIYASGEERIKWLQEKLEGWLSIMRTLSLPDDKLYLAAHAFFIYDEVLCPQVKT